LHIGFSLKKSGIGTVDHFVKLKGTQLKQRSSLAHVLSFIYKYLVYKALHLSPNFYKLDRLNIRYIGLRHFNAFAGQFQYGHTYLFFGGNALAVSLAAG